MASLLIQKFYMPMESVFRAGDPAETLYIIVEGEVRIEEEGQTTALLSANDFFGEMAILENRPA